MTNIFRQNIYNSPGLFCYGPVQVRLNPPLRAKMHALLSLACLHIAKNNTVYTVKEDKSDPRNVGSTAVLPTSSVALSTCCTCLRLFCCFPRGGLTCFYAVYTHNRLCTFYELVGNCWIVTARNTTYRESICRFKRPPHEERQRQSFLKTGGRNS